MTRPVVGPGTAGKFLIVSDRRLYVVDAREGPARDITPPDLVGQITAIAIPPDARRIAFVAGGKAYVAALVHGEEGAISLRGQSRRILANQVPAAVAVAWTSETKLIVAGANGNRPALWQVTADGVAAVNRSGDFTNGLRPVDVVAHPESPVQPGSGEITVMTNQGAGRLFNTVDIETDLTLPFYAG